jgi:hypothetical protein
MIAEWPEWLLATINEGHEGAIKKEGRRFSFDEGRTFLLEWPPS